MVGNYPKQEEHGSQSNVSHTQIHMLHVGLVRMQVKLNV